MQAAHSALGTSPSPIIFGFDGEGGEMLYKSLFLAYHDGDMRRKVAVRIKKWMQRQSSRK